MFQNIGEMLVLLWRAIQAMPHLARQRQKVYDQLFEIGNASLLMACILSLFIGGVISLQNRPLLPQRGPPRYIGGLLGNADCQEQAPPVVFLPFFRRARSALAG